MKIALAQISPKISKSNLESHISIIKDAIANSAKVVIFPELSLNGYKMMDFVVHSSYTIDELRALRELSSSIDIVVGVALREGSSIYNASIYFSDNEIRHVHRKNILPNYTMFEEARYFFKGDKIESFDSMFGVSNILICEDLWSSKTLYELSKNSPSIVFVISCSPARDFYDGGLAIEDRWDALLKSLSILNGAYTVFVNRVGFEDGMGFWGGSRVISPLGNLLFKSKKFEESIDYYELNMKITENQKYLLRNN